MNITGDKIKIKQKDTNIYNYFSKPENFEKIIPKDNLIHFSSDEKGFVFSLKGMPEIALKIEDPAPYSLIIYSSAKNNLDFKLNLHITNESENLSECQFIFSGNFNPLISMMVEKPLKNFIHSITNELASFEF